MDSPQTRPRRRRRIAIVALGVVVLGGLLLPVAAGPLVRRAAIDRLEQELYAHARIERLSIGLGGTLELEGLALDDLDGRPLARVRRLDVDVGLVSTLLGSPDLTAAVEGLEVHAWPDASGAWDPAGLWREDAPSRRAAGTKGARAEEPLPDVAARLDLRGGRVVLHGEGGETELDELAASCALTSWREPAEVRASFLLRGPGGEGGRFSARGDFTLDPARVPLAEGVRAHAELALQDGRIEALLPVVATVAPLEEAAGRFDLALSVELRDGLALSGTASLTAADLELAGPQDEPPAAIRSVELRLAATPAEGGRVAHTAELRADEFLTVRYSGQALARGLPPPGFQGTCSIDASCDRIAEIARGWVPLKRHVSFGGRLLGTVDLSSQPTDGGRELYAVDAELEARELTARDPRGRSVDLGELSQVSLALAATGSPALGVVTVPTLRLSAGPVQVEGTLALRGLPGSAQDAALELQDSSLTMNADLDRLWTILARIAELGDQRLAGKLSARVAALTKGNETELTCTADVDSLVWASGKDDADALKLDAWHSDLKGTYEARTGRLEIGALSLASDFLELSGDGFFEELAGRGEGGPNGSFELRHTLRPERIPSAIAAWAGLAGITGAPIEGTSRLRVDGSTAQVEVRLTTDRLEIRRSDAAASAPIVQESLAVELVATAGTERRLDRLELRSRSGIVRASGSATPDRPLELTATVEGDVGAWMTDLGIESADDDRELSGALRAELRAAGSNPWTIDGDVSVHDLVLVLGAGGEKPLRLVDPAVSVRIASEARLEEDLRELDLRSLELDSTFARGNLHGRLVTTASGGLRIEGAEGDLTYVPDRLGALLEPWLPGRLSGEQPERLSLRFSGEASELDVAALLAGSEGTASFGLGRLVAAGFDSSGTVEMRVAGGRATCTGDLATNGGRMRVEGDLALGEPTAGEAPRPSRLVASLEDVGANAELSPLLAHLHPAFAAIGSLKGGELSGVVRAELDLTYDAPLTPELLEGGWEALPKQPIHGRGSFELDGAKLRGAPFLDALQAELGGDPEKPLRLRPVEFTIQAGRLSYAKPWTWTLSGSETTFTGSIGLDETLDLAWSVPIGPGLVERYDFLSALAGQTITVPIRGNVRRPKLEWSDTLRDVAKKAAVSALGQELGLDRLLGGEKPKDGEAPGDDPASLLREADRLWDAGQKTDAAKLYDRIRDDFKLSAIYLLNRDRIKKRAGYKGD